MPTLSENQRGIVSMLSGLLIYMAAAPTSIVPDGPYAPAARTALGLVGVAGLGLQKFLQEPAQDQSDQLTALRAIVTKFVGMTPAEQQTSISLFLSMVQALLPVPS